MGKKIVAFCAGKRNGNTETYVKIALEQAKAMGCDVELIRLNECDLRPCKACPTYPCAVKGPDGCILKDDARWLLEKFIDCDGFIMASPVWALAPAGVVSDFRDRIFGPKCDVASWELYGTPEWMRGRTQYRPGALISVGGALTENWTSLGLATLYTTTFSSQINVIDHLNIHGVADPGEALVHEDYVMRAKYLGQNLAHAVNHPELDWTKKYLGETPEEEACPGCHNSLLIAKPGRDYVECAICGRVGSISMQDGKMRFVWPEDDGDRLTVMGKFKHMREIAHHAEIFAKQKDSIADALAHYKALDFSVRPPRNKEQAKPAQNS